MKIRNLNENSAMYTSNAYLITGTWNALSDVNTLVDTGRDPKVLNFIEGASTGVGKKRIEQIVITHNHYDHISLLTEVVERYKPKVFAYSESILGNIYKIDDGTIIKMGDCAFEAIHMPFHSSDSVGYLCEKEKVLFTGDVLLTNQNLTNQPYAKKLQKVLYRLLESEVNTIYPGHGKIITNAHKAIMTSYRNTN